MDSYTVIKELRIVGLAPELGYKLKTPKMKDAQLWRFRDGAWREVLSGSETRFTEAQCLNALEVGVTHSGLCLVVWDCCCPDCLPESKREWTRAWCKRTGLFVSHGYAPECTEKMMALARASESDSLKVSRGQ
jgi:hypothetical protein